MNVFLIILAVISGCYTLFDSYRSFKKGVFKEYRKMAPYVYHHRGSKAFIFQIIMNTILGVVLFGFAVWFWFETA